MIRTLFAVALLIGSTSLWASPLEGVFGHEYTRNKNAPVWTLRANGEHALAITHHGDGSVNTLQLWNDTEKASFWRKMLWNPKSATQALCAANDDEVFCYVPRLAREQIDWLRDYASDYFSYSEMGGIMQIQRVGN